MRKCLLVTFAAIALGVAGCSDVVVYDTYGERGTYHAGDLDYAGRRGAIHTIVAGNPFGGDKAQFDARVRALMLGQNRSLPVNFVPTAGPQTDPLYSVVVAFDMPANIDPDTMCRERANLPSRPQSGTVRMSIAFCKGDTAESDSYGIASNVTGIDDPKFARLVRETTFVMIPDEDLLEQDRKSNNEPPQMR